MTFIKNIQQQNNLNTQLIQKTLAFRATNTGFSQTVYELPKDSFVTYPGRGTFDIAQIEAAAKSNPRIMEILNTYGIPLKVNMEELEKLKSGHMKDVRVNVAKIYSALPPELKSQVAPVALQEAAMLHDFGKILIPDEILNKTGSLTTEEREIIEQHSELGYELLKSLGSIEPEVLELVKYHHQTANGGGYPRNGENQGSDLAVQILRAADCYSALREPRPYKPPMSREKALEIMREDVESGKMSEEVYQALCKIVE